MAQASKLSPFILAAEGKYSHVSGDVGGETMMGITYIVFQKYFGTDHDRFMRMNSDDWTTIFEGEYWNKIFGNQINSQKIANTIGDWIFNSGQHFPEKDVQELINHIFGKHLAEDGVFGQQTIDAINSVNQDEEYSDLIERRRQFYQNIIDEAHERNDYSQDKFKNGWFARIDNLVTYNLQFS